MTILGVALLALGTPIGVFLGDRLGIALGVKANVGGVGLAMILLIAARSWLLARGKLGGGITLGGRVLVDPVHPDRGGDGRAAERDGGRARRGPSCSSPPRSHDPMLAMIEHVFVEQGLVAAFATVGALMPASNLASRWLTAGRVHGSAIAIVLGLVLAYVRASIPVAGRASPTGRPSTASA